MPKPEERLFKSLEFAGSRQNAVLGSDYPRPGGSGRPGRSGIQQTAVEITFKPQPVYTDEARRLRIEGEVRLYVLFKAAGQVNVLGIARSLGYGLDQSAVRATEQIRFKPALREGTPVDSTATLHIVFQLAY